MSFWDALAGAAGGFGAAWDFKKKSELAERMEKEREERAEQRQIAKEQRREQRELRTPDPARDQADPERGVVKLFNKNGDPIGEIPMSEHQREGIELGRKAERVSLDNLVTTGDINRTKLEHMPLELDMKQEAHTSRLETDAARRMEATARAEAARARAAGPDVPSGATGISTGQAVNSLVSDHRDLVEQYTNVGYTMDQINAIAEASLRSASRENKDVAHTFQLALRAHSRLNPNR